MTSKHQDKKILSFQGLRAFAIILIILSHCDYIANQSGGNALMYAGGIGVQLFIMLSGYLAYYNASFASNNKNYCLTLKRKIGKFYPLHIITLIISLPLCISLFTGSEVIKNLIKLLSNLLMINAWIPKIEFYFCFNAVSWYLSLVVFFFIITPIVIKIIKRISNRILIVLMLVIIAGQFLWAYFVSANSSTELAHWLIYVCPLIRSFDFINGAIICKVLKEFKNKNIANYIINIGTILILVADAVILYSSLNISNEMYSVAYWSVPSVLLITLLSLGDNKSGIVRALFENPVIIFIGNISLELFLIHQLVIRYVRGVYNKVGWGKNISLYIFAIAISVFLAYCWQLISKKVKMRKK